MYDKYVFWSILCFLFCSWMLGWRCESVETAPEGMNCKGKARKYLFVLKFYIGLIL